MSFPASCVPSISRAFGSLVELNCPRVKSNSRNVDANALYLSSQVERVPTLFVVDNVHTCCISGLLHFKFLDLALL